MNVYQYAFDGLYKVDAQTVGEICETLENSNEGLTPESLVEYARDELSPIHDLFEWNDYIAAEKYRIVQAQNIIKNIRCEVQGDNAPIITRAFICIPGGQSRYVTLETTMNNKTYLQHMIDESKKEALNYMAKYHHIIEFAGHSKLIHEMNLYSKEQ